MAAEETKQQPKGWRAGITRSVVVLGLASLFTDISSEMIIPLRLLFLVQVLGTPLALAGLVEGLAEGVTSILRLFAGRLADRARRRVPLVIAGVAVSNLVKPLLAVVTTWPQALGVVLVDRSGKSIRGSPRDAIIADATTARHRGKAFGFHRGMDTLGAAIGPLLAILILTANPTGIREVFAWTAVPGLLAILVVVLFLRARSGAPAAASAQAAPAQEARPAAAQTAQPADSRLGTRFWLFVGIATVFALGNSSDAFIFLRTEGLEQSLQLGPLLYFAFNLLYALLAPPLGALSDRWGRLPVLLAGYAAFALVYMGWATATQ
ncbi:MAG TPA: MFS transporter, partial [Ktedonobacterales bacterium]|nr:MFS transporter [Ktedonobacterales bacterium]